MENKYKEEKVLKKCILCPANWNFTLQCNADSAASVFKHKMLIILNCPVCLHWKVLLCL